MLFPGYLPAFTASTSEPLLISPIEKHYCSLADVKLDRGNIYVGDNVNKLIWFLYSLIHFHYSVQKTVGRQ